MMQVAFQTGFLPMNDNLLCKGKHNKLQILTKGIIKFKVSPLGWRYIVFYIFCVLQIFQNNIRNQTAPLK